jgi:hypothetical protein
MGPGQSNSSVFYLLKIFQTDFNLIQSKDGVLLLGKFQIKYGFEAFEIRNNFLHRNFFRFELYYE